MEQVKIRYSQITENSPENSFYCREKVVFGKSALTAITMKI